MEMKCSRVTLSILLAVLGGAVLALGPAEGRQGVAADLGVTGLPPWHVSDDLGQSSQEESSAADTPDHFDNGPTPSDEPAADGSAASEPSTYRFDYPEANQGAQPTGDDGDDQGDGELDEEEVDESDEAVSHEQCERETAAGTEETADKSNDEMTAENETPATRTEETTAENETPVTQNEEPATENKETAVGNQEAQEPPACREEVVEHPTACREEVAEQPTGCHDQAIVGETAPEERTREEAASDHPNAEETAEENARDAETANDHIANDDTANDEMADEETASDETVDDQTADEDMDNDEMANEETAGEETTTDDAAEDEGADDEGVDEENAECEATEPARSEETDNQNAGESQPASSEPQTSSENSPYLGYSPAYPDQEFAYRNAEPAAPAESAAEPAREADQASPVTESGDSDLDRQASVLRVLDAVQGMFLHTLDAAVAAAWSTSRDLAGTNWGEVLRDWANGRLTTPWGGLLLELPR
jgi:hypothetical protein